MQIDASLFVDDDGAVHFVYQDGKIALNRRVLVEDSSVLVDVNATTEDKDQAMFPLFEQVSRRLVSARKKKVFIDAHPDVYAVSGMFWTGAVTMAL